MDLDVMSWSSSLEAPLEIQAPAPARSGSDQLASNFEDMHLEIEESDQAPATRSTRETSSTAPLHNLLQHHASSTDTKILKVATRKPLQTLSVANTSSQPGVPSGPKGTLRDTTRISKHEHLQRRAQWQPRIPAPRNPIQELPVPLRVYFMPDGRYVPRNSLIHGQKRQNGFFLHPILVINVDPNQGIAHFYALTRNPPDAIRDLRIYLRFGTTTTDEGEDTLKLAEGSEPMQQVTFANMEQLYRVEYQFLDYWRGNVAIDTREWFKIEKKVNWLESQQNRYIYKPLQRSMEDVVSGVILMLPNPPEASTLGAPILVVEARYPYFRFLRVKEVNGKGTLEGVEKTKNMRSLCLRICRRPDQEDEPVLLFAPDSAEMRNPSYLECSKKVRWVHCDNVKTWSYPHVRLAPASMVWLKEYLTNLPEPQNLAAAGSGPVVARSRPAFPPPARTTHPRAPTTFRPYVSQQPTKRTYAQENNWHPPMQNHAVAMYQQQAGSNVYTTPLYHGPDTHLPQVASPCAPYPGVWGHHYLQPGFAMAPPTGRTAYATSSSSTPTSIHHTEESDSNAGNGYVRGF